MAVFQAKQQGIRNFSLLVSQVRVPPAVTAILGSPTNRVQAFLAAGHVCTVMATGSMSLGGALRGAIVVTGFEPLDIVNGILGVVRQLETGRAEVENAYQRVVARQGNQPAQKLIAQVFEGTDRQWRGIGMIPDSAGSCVTSIATSTPRCASTWRHPGARVAGMHQRVGAARGEEATRMPGLRPRVHPGPSPGRDDGLLRGSLRRYYQYGRYRHASA